MRLKNLAVLCLCLVWGCTAWAVLLNGTAAKVGKTIITVEDAYFYHALNAFKGGASDSVNRPSTSELRKTVQKMIFEEMVALEAQTFKFQEVPKGLAQAQINRQKGQSRPEQWRQILSRFGKTESAALSLLDRSILVERFVQRKVETLTPIITDVEVERYYRQNPGRFKDKTVETAKPTIVLILKKQRVESGLEEWIRFLKKKYQVAEFLES
ncbi:MAG: hypothetical protein KDD39_08795 [Bdellovibrionales bacterium]|nr:hypothetical protein [Bdellovibrionales bacterium]